MKLAVILSFLVVQCLVCKALADKVTYIVNGAEHVANVTAVTDGFHFDRLITARRELKDVVISTTQIVGGGSGGGDTMMMSSGWDRGFIRKNDLPDEIREKVFGHDIAKVREIALSEQKVAAADQERQNAVRVSQIRNLSDKANNKKITFEEIGELLKLLSPNGSSYEYLAAAKKIFGKPDRDDHIKPSLRSYALTKYTWFQTCYNSETGKLDTLYMTMGLMKTAMQSAFEGTFLEGAANASVQDRCLIESGNGKSISLPGEATQ